MQPTQAASYHKQENPSCPPYPYFPPGIKNHEINTNNPAVKLPLHPSHPPILSPPSNVRMSPPGVRAAMAAMAPTTSMPHMRLADIRLLPPPRISIRTMEEGQNTRNKKENGIHNPKGKARLLHRALLIGAEIETPHSRGAKIAKRDGVWRTRGHVRAVLVGDVAQGVDAADEGADEEEVDEGDEAGVVGGAVVGEERGDGPGEGEDRDDEEDEDVVGGEGVGAVVDVDEVGEHAHCWDLVGSGVSMICFWVLGRLGRKNLRLKG
ncbi:hypothetical protein ONS95_006243 [Cadophora gregata]|uniref:uncharacterized protein n=1 Tax=Cadophora gregata TaxID=51156 RepID=UPI0026DC2989|nr:uncharacterized protein ONS95_006243 [Cadophora gregata]KAK0102639.1 hypothetical protein ONS95_006243 [Cadophora gregata]KAK0104291.1 hypothetical protein ONS96_005381 [Cadophora gregata f. sp. sojae]